MIQSFKQPLVETCTLNLRVFLKSFHLCPASAGLFHATNPVPTTRLSSPTPHQNTEPPSPLLLLVVTTTAGILKVSRGQNPKTVFSHQLIPMTTQFIELETINDQDLQAAAGGDKLHTSIVNYNPVVIDSSPAQRFPFSNKSSFLTMPF